MSMRTFKSWRWLPRKKYVLPDGIEAKRHPFDNSEESRISELDGLPRGIIHARSDLELKPLWSRSREKVRIPLDELLSKLCSAVFRKNKSRSPPPVLLSYIMFDSQVDDSHHHNLLAIAVGIKQKHNVDTIVQKFLAENFTIVLFHYDRNMNGWWDLDWNNRAIHIAAENQTKWWFAKRFLHPDVVSIYDYIFLWDEDLGVEHFDPGRYLEIVRSERLEISQPALDRNSTEIHHRITARKKAEKLHRRIYDSKGVTKCSSSSMGPPCTGWVEGMAPVFSRSAWRCTWHLIQNDLVHGWGLDMKLGYCAQGDRTKRVGIVDSEYIVHQGIQTLGGSGGLAAKKALKAVKTQDPVKRSSGGGLDSRMEVRADSVQ
ncbi:hypothetical protein Cgig2_003357 [Carnegiea gigantea]|uniref:DUF707 domain-containing protein n=1 Tax=Carnegiea gigantea TaxID=171969 RepID=A0A9Q1K188_9CARY|nr:hypothetical protein Cgig2_003357 [Carnegiea gigantea]